MPKRGIGDRAEAMIDALSLREKITFPQALRRVDEAYGMAARSANAVKRFNTLMEELRTIVESGAGPAVVLEAVLERTGYLAELQASTDPQDETRIENLQELAAVALEFEQERGSPPGRKVRARARSPSSWRRSRSWPTPTRSPTRTRTAPASSR